MDPALPISAATRVTYVGHSCVLIEIGGVRLLTDPVLTRRVAHLRRQNAPIDPNQLRDIDAILISHLHADHLHLPSLSMLETSTRVIGPHGTSHLLKRVGFGRIDEVGLGETVQVGELSIRSTYAEHRGYRYPAGPYARAMGFLIRGRSGIYFAGDTDVFEEMADLQPGLDLAMLPVWGWGPTLGRGHLTPRRAAEALRRLQPRLAIPIHWGTYLPLGMGWMKPSSLTRPPVEFQAAASLLAPEVRVRILEPGSRLELSAEVGYAKT